MKLKAYLKKRGITLRGLARKANLNEATVWRAVHGKSIFLASAIAISRATKNAAGEYEVKIEDLQQKELDL